MALLSLVRAADRRLGLGLQLAALHVDYGLRGADSDRDRRIVERALPGRRPAAARGAAARPARRAGLPGAGAGAAVRARPRARRRGTATTCSSRRTTATTRRRPILYRLAKYASPRGLAGMRPRDGDLARPLLGLGAAEIREYCRAAGIEYGEDVDQRRAAVRAQRPAPRGAAAARGVNPRLAETLAAGAEQAAAEADVLAAATAEARARVLRPPAPGDLAAVDLAALAAEPPALRALVLHELVRDAMGGEALVERRLVEALLRLAERADDAGRVTSAAVWRRSAAAARCASAPPPRRTRARRPAWTAPPRGRGGEAGLTAAFCGRAWRLRLLAGAAFDREAALAGAAFAGLAAAPRRVTLRHPRRGERFAPLGLGGETTVARYLAAARRARRRAAAAPCSTSTAPPPGWAAAAPPAGLRSPSA